MGAGFRTVVWGEHNIHDFQKKPFEFVKEEDNFTLDLCLYTVISLAF